MCPGGYPLQENQNWQSGFLPGVFQGTYVDSKHTDVEKLVEFVKNKIDFQGRPTEATRPAREAERHAPGRTAQRPAARSADTVVRVGVSDADGGQRRVRHYEGTEDTVLEAYGRGEQARSLLIARRLIERGVRFVQVSHGPVQPWDSHDDLEVSHKRLAGQVDQGHRRGSISDLKRLGLFEETLILWGGEFGRTPVGGVADARLERG